MRKRAIKNTRQNQKQATGSIRIIAGKHRGRKLPVLSAEGLRPTTDRVKETVFNWLMPYLNDSVCLDCFAGAGSLGFEALSRGAAHVSMIELNKQAASQLEQNIKLLGERNVSVANVDAAVFLQQVPTKTFDLVFVDPPFRKGLAKQICLSLTNGWLNDNALVYLETEIEEDTSWIPATWQPIKEKIAGQVKYQLIQVG